MDPRIMELLSKIRSGGFPGGGMGGIPGMDGGERGMFGGGGRSPYADPSFRPGPGGMPMGLPGRPGSMGPGGNPLTPSMGRLPPGFGFGKRPQGPMPGKKPMRFGGSIQRPGAGFAARSPIMGRPGAKPKGPTSMGSGTVGQALGR